MSAAEVLTDDCPEALVHGAFDAKGKCGWCGWKVLPTAPRPATFPVSDLTEAYGLYYDPDWEPKDGL